MQPADALVDRAWYLARNPDVAAAGQDPAAHFRDSGWREGRWPNPYFDTPAYLRRQPGLAENPLLHYLEDGEAAGIRPVPEFDAPWYRAAYGIPEGACCLLHFLRHRHAGQVSPNPGFDAAYYYAANPDVRDAGRDPFEHYRTFGRAEGRLPRDEADILRDSGLFDGAYYMFNAPDVRLASQDPLTHFIEYGWREGRKPNLYFDPAWYQATYGAATTMSPLTRYVLDGEALGHRPSLLFDPAWYRDTQMPAESQASPLAHYLAHRTSRPLSPLPLFDAAFYMQEYGADIPSGRDPFMHYLAQGTLRELNPSAWFDAAAYRRTRMTEEPRRGARLELANPMLHLLTRLSPVAP